MPNIIIATRYDMSVMLVRSILLGLAWAAAAYGHSGESESHYPTNSLLNPGALYPLGGGLPPSRVHHSATYVNRYVIVFGGLSTAGTFLDDIHLFDTLSKTWSGPVLKKLCCNDDGSVIEALGADQETIHILPSLKVGLEGDLPLARAEHTAVNIDDKMYIFGGLTADGFMNDMYVFDPIALRWSLVDYPLGPMPTRRAGHAATESGSEQFVLFGGRTGNTLNFTKDTRMMNDVWNFDRARQIWRHMRPTSAQAPSPRQYAAAVVMGGRLYIFGGIDGLSDVVFNDVWSFDLYSQTWSQLSPNSGSVQGYAPPPLYGSRLVPIVDFDGTAATPATGLRRQGFLVYGGVGGGAACAGRRCKDLAVSIGQVYKYEIIIDDFPNNSSAKMLNSELASEVDNPVVYDDVKSSGWRYARLAREDKNGEGGSDSAYRGKRTKRYVLEAVALSLDRKIMYEFGGLEAVDQELLDNGQTLGTVDGIRQSSAPVFMSGGGVIPEEPSDLESGERLRSSVDIPYNGVWHYKQSFVRTQPREEMDFIAFLNEFRTYRINPIDIVHLFQM